MSYRAVATNPTATMARHVSTRLPLSCLALFETGRLAVEGLDEHDREWLAAESAMYGNAIDFEGVQR